MKLHHGENVLSTGSGWNRDGIRYITGGNFCLIILKKIIHVHMVHIFNVRKISSFSLIIALRENASNWTSEQHEQCVTNVSFIFHNAIDISELHSALNGVLLITAVVAISIPIFWNCTRPMAIHILHTYTKLLSICQSILHIINTIYV